MWTGAQWLLTQDVWLKSGAPSWTGLCADGSTGEAGATWEEYEWRHKVEGAEDWLSGTVRFNAYSTSGGVVVGAQVPILDVDVSRSIEH